MRRLKGWASAQPFVASELCEVQPRRNECAPALHLGPAMMLHITINGVAIRGGATPLIVAISGWSGGFGRAFGPLVPRPGLEKSTTGARRLATFAVGSTQ
jgi:hypothetical protein